MNRLNNKGFAISTMLYGLLIVIVLVMFLILNTMSFNRKNSKDFTDQVIKELEERKQTKFIKAYTYSQFIGSDYCIDGTQPTCRDTTCYKKGEGRCPTGTIIVYMVNPTTILSFNVIYDNGTTITMQQRENTIKNDPWIPWISKEDYVNSEGDELEYGGYGNNNKGPITILNALENATKDWSNVNEITYTAGITKFPSYEDDRYGSRFTGCSNTFANFCDTNTYTMTQRTARARMITLQEANVFGQCGYELESCQKWMYNYLQLSTEHGGTQNDTTDGEAGNDAYWTMSAHSNDSGLVWRVHHYGKIDSIVINNLNKAQGARAVVEVDKET